MLGISHYVCKVEMTGRCQGTREGWFSDGRGSYEFGPEYNRPDREYSSLGLQVRGCVAINIKTRVVDNSSSTRQKFRESRPRCLIYG